MHWRRNPSFVSLSLALTGESLLSATDFSGNGDSAVFSVNLFRCLTFPIVIAFA